MDTAVACLSCERRVCRPALAKAELVILLVIERDLVSSVMHVRVEKSRVGNIELSGSIANILQVLFLSCEVAILESEFVVPILELRIKHS